MAVAALTPRVRAMVICDDVAVSLSEPGLFTPQRVRLRLDADSFPHRATLSLFMLLSSPRNGRYAGRILIANQRNGKSIRYARFLAEFERDNELLALRVYLGECIFSESGVYNFEIYFSAPEGGEALKGELALAVRPREE